MSRRDRESRVIILFIEREREQDNSNIRGRVNRIIVLFVERKSRVIIYS